MPSKTRLLPAACAEVFADSDGIVASPRSVRAKICLPKVPVTGAEPVEEKVLSNARFESLAEIDGSPPGMFDADGIE